MDTSGNSQRFDIVNGRQLSLLIVPVVFFVLAALAVAARWYTRTVRRVNTVIEDVLCALALAMSFAVVTLVYILVFLCGEGLTSDEIRNDPTRNFEQVRRNWLRMQFGVDICWATSVTFVQIAFCKYYVRLYEHKRLVGIGFYCFMGLITIWYIWSIAGWVSLCHPPGRCNLQSKKACIANGSIHVAFNAMNFCASVPAILTGALSKQMKSSAGVLCFLGSGCIISAVLRIDCAINIFGEITHDPIGASWWRVLFSPIEIAVAIICCCVPKLSPQGIEPLWRRERPSLPTESTGLRRLKFRSTSGSSSTSNLNPAHWHPGPKAQINAFVTLDNGKDKPQERSTSLGPREIQVTKDYQLDRRML